MTPVPGVTWVNCVDDSTPYETCFEGKCWNVSVLLSNIIVLVREYDV